jgi:hypothetical protein
MAVTNWSIRIPYLLSSILIATCLYAAPPDSNVTTIFTGEVTDSLCAAAGSHEPMMQQMKSMSHDKATCSAKCVQLGAKYVLYDSGNKTIYALDNQEKAANFAGHNVRISGTLQKKKIKVASIEATD